KSALSSLSADCERDPLLHVVMALASLGWVRPDGTDAGYDLWAAWSATGKTKFMGEHDLQTRWRSFGRHGITIGTLFHMAEQAGWQGYYPETEVMPHNSGTNHGSSPHNATPHPFFASTGGAVPHANGHTVNLPEELSGNNPGPLIELNKAYSVIGD